MITLDKIELLVGSEYINKKEVHTLSSLPRLSDAKQAITNKIVFIHEGLEITGTNLACCK